MPLSRRRSALDWLEWRFEQRALPLSRSIRRFTACTKQDLRDSWSGSDLGKMQTRKMPKRC